MKNALLTFVQGKDFAESVDADIFLTTLSKFKTFDKICFVKDLTQQQIETFKKYFTVVVEVKNPILNGARDRFMSYYQWLVENFDNYEYVMHVDFRDVIIQKDPFDFMKQHPDKDVFVVNDGVQIKTNEWNFYDMKYYHSFLSAHKDDFMEYYVVNGGTIGGKPFAVSQLFLLLWINSNRVSKSNTDQATLNYLYPYLMSNPKIMVCSPFTDSFCATGEGIKWGFVPCNFDGKKVQTTNNETFYIYHQWDRTEHADKIRNNHLNTFSFVI
jgi:hypothetical protein